METGSRIIFAAATEVEPEWEEEWHRWYRAEHLPNLLALPGIHSARRYVAVEGEPKALDAGAGGGYGFRFRTPDGLPMSISSDSTQHPNIVLDRARPTKISAAAS